MGPTVTEERPRRRGDPGAVSNVRFCRVDSRVPPGDPARKHQEAPCNAQASHRGKLLHIARALQRVPIDMILL